MAEAAIELAAAKQREDEGLNFSMAAVSVTVLEDAALRVSEACVRVPLPGSRGSPRARREQRAAVCYKRAGRRRGGGREKTAPAASSASKVVRYALQVQPRLVDARAEKFRNEVKARGSRTTTGTSSPCTRIGTRSWAWTRTATS